MRRKKQSIQRQIARGHVITSFNSLTKKMETFKRSNKGLYILCSPFTGQFINKGPGTSAQQLNSQ